MVNKSRQTTEGMVHLPGGRFLMGSDRFYSEERPARPVHVDPFWIDATPVTIQAFADFVEQTGYLTEAQRPPDPTLVPAGTVDLSVGGSLVFHPVAAPRVLAGPHEWWHWSPGANWKHPLGPDSSVEGQMTHPVVHVTHADALAFAHWAGKSLPTEAEWEFAARGGLEGADYVWGDELAPGGSILANYWQGEFPFVNTLEDGWERTSPVMSFPPNGYGLFDMAGNVWEWTNDWYGTGRAIQRESPGCCIPRNPTGVSMEFGRGSTGIQPVARKVVKGGSHLCAPNFCQRYRPAARQPQEIDTSTSHIGFRCIVRQ